MPDNNPTSTAAAIVAAYVANNHVQAAELPALIASVHRALAGLTHPATAAEAPVERPTAAQIQKSITDDGLISFIDGKPYQMLRRHLTSHGMTPESYRAQFGLPVNYPMTAQNYAARRSEISRTIGLDRRGRRRDA